MNKYIILIISAIVFMSVEVLFAQSRKVNLNGSIPYHEYIQEVDLSPNGKYFVTGSSDQSIKIWRTSDGKLLRTVSNNFQLLSNVKFSLDGKYIIAGTTDNAVKLWNVSDGKHVRTYKGYGNYIGMIALSQDGKYIAAGGNPVHIWNFLNCNVIQIFKKFRGNATITFSRDNKYLATGGSDKKIKIWSVSNGKLLHEIDDNMFNRFSRLQFSSDSKYIFSDASYLNNNKKMYLGVKIWQISDSQLIRELKNEANINVGPDGKIITCDTGYIKIWRLDSQNPEKVTKVKSKGLFRTKYRLSHDGKFLMNIRGSYSSLNFEVLRVKDGKVIHNIFCNKIHR